MYTRYRELLAEVADWGHQTFPRATVGTVATHLVREIAEWEAEPQSGEEMADVLMVLAHLRRHLEELEYAVLKNAHRCQIALCEEIARKLGINKKRTWGPPDAEGVVEHERPVRTHNCEICQGLIEEREGAVFHVLERVIIGGNPHEGWWRDHLGTRYLCDDCYAEQFHGSFDYGSPPYTPRYAAVLEQRRRP